MMWLAHDLLWLDRFLLVAGVEKPDLPDWVTSGNGPVVVRRERVSIAGLVAVGVRGANKNERCAAYAPLSAVQSSLTPYEITRAQAWLDHPDRFKAPVLQALETVAQVLDGHNLEWGITGSLGYELATGDKQIHAKSDLDLVIKAPKPLSKSFARELLKELGELPCRLDIQIETMTGAIALLEWAGKSSTVLIKTEKGPFLVANPWEGGMPL